MLVRPDGTGRYDTSIGLVRQRISADVATVLRDLCAAPTASVVRGERAWTIGTKSDGDMARLFAALGRAGLTSLTEPHLPGGLRGWRVFDGTTGNVEVNRALGTLIIAPEASEAQRGLPDVLDCDFDVDIVYTWVDGSDPQWRSERDRAGGVHPSGLLPTANDDARFTSHDELRYSLRALESFAPWARRIYLVTSGQAPTWLDTSDHRLVLVSHPEIFGDPRNLPTFNSHAIEAQLHRIAGLAEHFLYFNDDVFLGRPIHPEDFFTPAGQTRFFLSEDNIRPEGRGELPIDVAARNNRRVIEERFGRTTSRKFRHAPHPQRRSVLERIERENAGAVAGTAAARFRSPTDLSIPSSLAHYYGLNLGTAVASVIDYRYIDVSDAGSQLQLVRMMRRKKPQVFCLNEVADDPRKAQSTQRMLTHFLERTYPIRSSFERSPKQA